MTDPILPDHPDHKHHALYSQLLEQVGTAAPERPAEQHANLAAGLLDAHLRTRAKPGLRLDETDIAQLRVVAGNPDARTPSLFLVSGAQSDDPAARRVSVPLAMSDTAASQALKAYSQTRTIDADGYLTDPGITRTPIPALERDAMPAVNGIVLHRTMGSTAAGTLSHWRGADNPHGTHFLVDKDGTVHQTASLDRHTSHVGKIKSRGEIEGTLTAEEERALEDARPAGSNFARDATNIHRIESRHGYPQRYPTNADSIGIEAVGAYDEKTQTWDQATPEQLASIRRLIGTLQDNYGLDDNDIHEHDDISYKTQGEGAGLYQPGAGPVVDDAGLQQSAGPSR